MNSRAWCLPAASDEVARVILHDDTHCPVQRGYGFQVIAIAALTITVPVEGAVMSKSCLSLIGSMLAGLLAACSSMPSAQDAQQRQAAYVAAAGTPVRSFRLVLGDGIYSWEPLDDTQLVVYTRPTRAYLLDTWPCSGLSFTNRVGFTSFAGEVSVGFDKVLTARGYLPCAIKQIRPVDLARFKLEKEARRQADVVARDSPGAAPAPAASH